MNFAVGIVLYNSNVDKIRQTISEYKNEAKNIILIDNNSLNIDEVDKLVSEFSNVLLIRNEKNEGIARALNQILESSISLGINYLLTLDQDSFLQLNYLKKMMEYIEDDVAIVCPEIIDLNKKKNKLISEEYAEIERCITSGSLMNLNTCKEVGIFDEKMFIDYVDFDYCKRIRLKGYKILKIKDCFLKHEIGKRSIKKFFGIYVYPTNHSSFRVYYYFRNMRYYYLKFRKQMTSKEKINEIIRIYWKYISIILYEENKKDKLSSARKGFKDAITLMKEEGKK